jgi:5-methylcytosine-specific restriction endonuclease McrA
LQGGSNPLGALRTSKPKPAGEARSGSLRPESRPPLKTAEDRLKVAPTGARLARTPARPARYPRRVPRRPGTCRVCRENAPELTFEHVPPQAAFNNERTSVYGLDDWLERGEDGLLSGGRIEQRGAGDYTLCAECNSNTGSWYGNELRRAASSGVVILRQLPLDQLDAKLESTWVSLSFREGKARPHPLRLIKQIITMLLATSPVELSIAHPELGDFVRTREATGLPARFQFYLALFAGPLARSTGVAQRIDLAAGRMDTLVEVAFPPYAYVLTIDSEDDEALETQNITSCVDVGYKQTADLEMSLLVGFGHTPYPADYRTLAMVERDRAEKE